MVDVLSYTWECSWNPVNTCEYKLKFEWSINLVSSLSNAVAISSKGKYIDFTSVKQFKYFLVDQKFLLGRTSKGGSSA